MNKHIKKLILMIFSISLLLTLQNTSYAQTTQLIPAKVVKIIKGDTIIVTITERPEEVSLIGLDVPLPKYTDIKHFYGIEAYDYLNNFLINKVVFLEFDKEKIDQQGRLLAYVWLEEPVNTTEREIRSKMLNAKLLLEGYSPVIVTKPNTKYTNNFFYYQKEAQDNKLRYWI